MSVNKVILVGNVGRDPEVKYLDGGVCFARFSIATSDRAYTTAAGVQVPERTEWHNVVAWRGLAQIIERFVSKGTSVYVEGKLQTRQWDDASGQKRYTTEILVENLELLGGRREQGAQTERPPVPSEIPPYVAGRPSQGGFAHPSSPAAPSTSGHGAGASDTPVGLAPVQIAEESDDLPF